MSTTHAPFTAPSPKGIAHSSAGVVALIAQATARYEAALLGQAVIPLFPEDCPWDCVAAIPEKFVQRLQHQLSAVTAAVLDYRAGLTATAGQLATWLDANEDDVRELAFNFAKLDLTGMPDLSDIASWTS